MPLEVQKYLIDIQTSILSIKEILGEKRDFSFYKTNKLLRRGIKRELEIIGEVVNRLLQIDPEIDIEDARKKWVIHGYDKVDDIIVWGIICNYLPKLEKQVNNLITD